MDVVQTLMAPAAGKEGTWPLYLETGRPPGSGTVPFNATAEERKQVAMTRLTDTSTHNAADAFTVNAAGGIEVTGNTYASFATYFNAFPAAYWQQWSAAKNVELSVQIEGECILRLFRSNAKGTSTELDSKRAKNETVTFNAGLNQFGDGGWLWFDAEGVGTDFTVAAGFWKVPEESRRVKGTTKVTVGITTFNLVDECVGQMQRFAQSPALLDRVAEIIVVDQGSKNLVDAEGFAEAEAALGGKFRVIKQENLGGSGGFSRGMYEMLKNPDSQYVLLLDDDAETRAECVLRALDFADHTIGPVIVGGHMLNINEPTILHTLGEKVNLNDFWWHSALGDSFLEVTQTSGIDLAVHTIRQTPMLNKRVDPDFNGWWMCLIPDEVVREIGLSLPFFIKWDDAEYGLRARQAGFPTVSMPGVAAWHVPWTEKDDGLDWQAYFHQRNRWVAALIHGHGPTGMTKASFVGDVNHLLNMQYSAARLRRAALEDVLAGPDHLFPSLNTRAVEARKYVGQMPDGKLYSNAAEIPRDHQGNQVRTYWQARPTGRRKIVSAAKGLLRQLKSVPEGQQDAPTTRIPNAQAKWWRLLFEDSALVGNAAGSGVWWYRRSPEATRGGILRSASLHRKLMSEWDELSGAYRERLAQETAPEAWEVAWGISPSTD